MSQCLRQAIEKKTKKRIIIITTKIRKRQSSFLWAYDEKRENGKQQRAKLQRQESQRTSDGTDVRRH